MPPPPSIDIKEFEIDEIRERVESDKDINKKKIKLAQDNLDVHSKLLKKVEEDRIQITREFLESDKHNVARRLIVKGMKDKVDSQVSHFQNLHTDSQEKVSHLKKQEHQLDILDHLLQSLDELGECEQADSYRKNLMVEFEKYVNYL